MRESDPPLRRMIVATSIIGGASVITILIGLVRTKALALLIGPEGLGLMGLLITIMGTGTAIFGMGLGFSGVRQIAEGDHTRAIARRALWIATWPLAVAAMLVMWFGRHEFARLATGSTERALDVGLTGIGAALAILAASQLAVIQGLRQVGNLARVRIYGALLSLVVGVPAAAFGGRLGIVAAVIAVPLVQVVIGLFYRPPRDTLSPANAPHTSRDQLQHLFKVGATVMLSSTIGSLVMVWIRARIVQTQGLDAAGLYQAAYAISAMNVGVVLSAMGADYLPQLSSIKDDRDATNRLVNQQLQVALLIGTPLLCLMVALAPLVLNVLYSSEFTAASDVLRWQVMGEMLKLPAWAVSFMLVARRSVLTFLCLESLFAATYLGATYLLLPTLNVAGAGVAYLVAQASYLLAFFLTSRKRHGISFSGGNVQFLATAICSLLMTIAIAHLSAWAGAIIGTLCAGLFAAHAIREIDRNTNIVGRFRRKNSASRNSR